MISKRAGIGLSIKIGVVVLLFWLIARSTEWSEVSAAIRQIAPITFFILIALVLLQAALLAARWSLIVRARSYSFSFGDGFSGTLVSFFVAQGLPSSIGGDALRIWWMKRRDIPVREATVVVLLDRGLGFLTLLVLCAVSLFLMSGRAESQALSTVTRILSFSIGLGLSGGLILMLPKRLGVSGALSRRMDRLPKPIQVVLRMALDVRQYFAEAAAKPGEFSLIVVLGVVVHLVTVALAYSIALDLSLEVGVIDCLAVIPPALLFSYLPISIAGWGVREGIIVAAFALLGVSSGNALVISVLIGLSVLATSLFGGVIWTTRGIRDAFLAAEARKQSGSDTVLETSDR